MEVFAVTAAADLNPQLICAVADARPGRAVRIGRGLLGDVQQRCEQARAELRRGHPVYGVNTGMGALSGVLLTPAEQLEHQRNLMLARATGGAALAGCRGRAGDHRGPAAHVPVRRRRRLRAALPAAGGLPGRGHHPGRAAHRRGQRRRDHATGPRVRAAGRDRARARDRRPSSGRPAQALRDHGLGEFTLGPKEGIALLAGVPGATAMSVRRVAAARTLTAMMEAAAGLSIVAAGAPGDPYTAACARGDDILAGVLGAAQGRHRRRPRAQDAAGPGLVPGSRPVAHPGAAGHRRARRRDRAGARRGHRLARVPGRAVHRHGRLPRDRPGRALRPASRRRSRMPPRYPPRASTACWTPASPACRRSSPHFLARIPG